MDFPAMKTTTPDRNHPTRVALRRIAATHGCMLTFHLDGSVTVTSATTSCNHPTPKAALAALTPGANQ
jgi:hypothetical protein